MPERPLQCDVAVIGGGPAGIAAACEAAQRGNSVVLLENTPWLGGPIWRTHNPGLLPRVARTWLDRLARSGVQVLTESTAIACDVGSDANDPSVLFVEQQGRSRQVRFGQLVVAVGAQELLLPFPGWTLPNVFGVGGLQLLSKSGWPVRGKRVIVAGTGPLMFAVAASLARKGANVVEMLEQAPRRRIANFAVRLPWLAPSKVVQALGFQRSLIGVRYRAGCWPVAAEGGELLESVTVTNGEKTWVRECDYLACGFGLVPSLQWPKLLGCRLSNGGVEVDQWQQTLVPGVYSAGEATGIGGVDAAIVEGQIAGYAAAGGNSLSDVSRWFARRERARRFAAALRSAFRLRDELKELVQDDTIVCRCEDVTWGQIRQHDNLRSAKLQTRCGMGPCQGRVCHHAMQWLKSWDADHVRPPVLPASVGVLAGQDEMASCGE